MIKANDLRIGNRFIRELRTPRGMEYDHDFVLTEEMMGKLFGDNIEIALQDLFPIPLTHEILEKFGFMKRFQTDDCNIWDLGKEITVARLVDGWKYLTAPGAKLFLYLHQLQNLYFAIRHNDLEVTSQVHPPSATND